MSTAEVGILPRPIFDISPEVARSILGIRLTDEGTRRANELAEKARMGTLTAEERSEIDFYARAGSVLAIFQSQARLALKGA